MAAAARPYLEHVPVPSEAPMPVYPSGPVRLLGLLALLGSTVAGASADGGSAPAEGALVERSEYPLPAVLPSKPVYRLPDAAEYAEARKDARFRFERLRYASGGLVVHAYLYRPVDARGRKVPTIVFNRGSYTVGDIGAELLPLFHRLASEGFAVLAPLYRGSDGAPGRDEMGGAEVDDLMNVVPLARALGFIDMERLFLYGESRGGMMTFQALRRHFPARAAATFGAFTDLDVMLTGAPRMRQAAEAIWPDFTERHAHYQESRSVLRWAESIEAPLLMLHGGADGDVSPAQSLALAQRLQELGRTYELHVLAGARHTLERQRHERDRLAAAWFKRHLN